MWFRKAKKWSGIRSSFPVPHFLGVGTQKGGTTTLYRVLKEHKEVFMPDNKEIHYFTKYYAKGDRWYVEQFKEAKAGQTRGEITPYYLFHEAVPDRIRRLRSDMKIIVLLRDPVERTLSQYFHSYRLGLEVLGIEDALEAEYERLRGSRDIVMTTNGTHVAHQEQSYLSRSRYDEQLQRYRKSLGPENILVLKSEDMFRGQVESLDMLCDFLGIERYPYGQEIPSANRGNGEARNVNEVTKQMLREKLSKTYAWVEAEYGITW